MPRTASGAARETIQAQVDASTCKTTFYVGRVPETGSPARTWVCLFRLPQVALATAAADNRPPPRALWS